MKPSVHLWIVGILAVLWNGYGCFDYYMTMTNNAGYLASMGMTAEQTAYMAAMPGWTDASWAFGVWGGLLGSVLLLLRMKWAFHAFVVSLLGLLASLVYAFGLSNGAEVMGMKGLIMNGVVLAGCLFFVWYSRMMTANGTLR